jgi:uncharacterized protein YbaR (Trm112 family)
MKPGDVPGFFCLESRADDSVVIEWAPMALTADLLAIVACPESKAPMIFFSAGETGTDPDASFFLCPESRLRYRVESGVPVLLIEEAERLESAEVVRLVGRAKQLGIAGCWQPDFD